MVQRTLIFLSLLSACVLTGCASNHSEPIYGCTLAAANEREILRAQGYLSPALPARILAFFYADDPHMGHSALIYHLQEGWFVYDDTFGSRPLPLPKTSGLPAPLDAARAAFPIPPAPIVAAQWYGDTAPGRAATGANHGAATSR